MDYSFHKLHGCGNDFIFMDNRELQVPVEAMSNLARKLCARKTGIGADGLVFIEQAPSEVQAESQAAYRWHFYNEDGSRGEMCGNASRCVSWLAVDLGLAGTEHAFLSDAGLVQAQVDYERRWSKVQLTEPQDQRMDIMLSTSQGDFVAHYVDTGVPHAVIILADNSQLDVFGLGREIRNHPAFAPRGTNVNFVSVLNKGLISVRTYERGVEAETLACGTGAAASQLICNSLGLTETKADVRTTGGEILEVELREGKVFLAGVVTRVYQAGIDPVFWLQSAQAPCSAI